MARIVLDLEINSKGEANVRSLTDGLKDLGKESKATKSGLDSIFQGIGVGVGMKLFEGITTAAKAVPGVLLGAAAAALKFGDDVGAMAARMQIGTDAVQRLMFIADQSDVEWSKMEAGINKMSIALDKSPASFERLGLSIKDLKAMSPDEQFLAVAEAMGRIEEPAQRAGMATELFGKGGVALLPALTAEAKKLGDEFDRLGIKMGKDVVGAAGDMDNSIKKLNAVWDGLVRNLGAAFVQSEPLHRLLQGLTEILGDFSKGVQGSQGDLRSWVDGGVILAAKALGVLVTAIGFVIDAWTTFNIVMIAQKAAIEILIVWFMKQAEAIRHPTLALQKLKEGFADSQAVMSRASREIQDEIRLNGERQTKLALVGDQIDKMTARIVAADGATHKATGSANGHALALTRTAEETKRAEAAAKSYAERLMKEAEELEAFILSVQAVIAQGRQIAHQGMLRQIGDVEGSQRAAGTDLRSQIMGRDTVRPTTEREDAQRRQQELTETMGKVQMLTDAFLDLGVAIFGVDSLFARLAPVASSAVSAIAAFASGNIIGGIAATAQTIGSMITFWRDNEAAIKANQNAMKDLTAEFADTMQAAKDAGIILDETFDPSRPEEYREAMQGIQDQLDMLNEAHRLLNDAIERYGFTFEELGPALQQQRLHEQALELLRDFELLVAAGVDMEAILRRMGPAFTEMVQRAIHFGIALPESMRAAILLMIEHRQLLDENGRAYETLEETGLTFTRSLEQGMQRLIEMIAALVRALLGIPDRHVVVDVEERHRRSPGDRGNTPDENRDEPPPTASGGFFPGRPGGYNRKIGEAGDEWVLNEPQMRALTGGGAQTIVIPVSIGGEKLDDVIMRRTRGGYIRVGQ